MCVRGRETAWRGETEGEEKSANDRLSKCPYAHWLTDWLETVQLSKLLKKTNRKQSSRIWHCDFGAGDDRDHDDEDDENSGQKKKNQQNLLLGHNGCWAMWRWPRCINMHFNVLFCCCCFCWLCCFTVFTVFTHFVLFWFFFSLSSPVVFFLFYNLSTNMFHSRIVAVAIRHRFTRNTQSVAKPF